MERQNEATERRVQMQELSSRIARERIAPNAAEVDHTETG